MMFFGGQDTQLFLGLSVAHGGGVSPTLAGLISQIGGAYGHVPAWHVRPRSDDQYCSLCGSVRRHYFGGCSSLLSQPNTLSVFSGSGRSHSKHRKNLAHDIILRPVRNFVNFKLGLPQEEPLQFYIVLSCRIFGSLRPVRIVRKRGAIRL